MKKYLISFLKSAWKLLVTFVILFIVVFISSNPNNEIYKFLDKFSFSDDQKKNVLVGIVTLIIGLIELLIILVNKLFIWAVQKLLKKLKVDISFSGVGKSTKIVDKKLFFYQKSNGLFHENKLKVLLCIYPAGDWTMWILKKLKVRIEIFFNPQLFDVTLDNDQEWISETDQLSSSISINEEQAICINILDDYRLDSHDRDSFEIEEIIYVTPKGNLKKTSKVDYILRGTFIDKPFNMFCAVKIDSFTAIKGGKK